MELSPQRVGEDRKAASFFVNKMKRFSPKQRLDGDDFENDLEKFFPNVNEAVGEVASALLESLITIVDQQAKRKNRQPNKDRFHLNFFSQEFWEGLRLNRETFDFILEVIAHSIHKGQTYMVPNSIEEHRQVGLAMYRMVHGCSLVQSYNGNSWSFPVFGHRDIQ